MDMHPDDIAELKALIRMVRGMRGDGQILVSVKSSGITIGLAPTRPYDPNTFSGGGKSLYKITEANGTFPAFAYVGQRITGYDSSLTGHARWTTDGVDVDLINRCEFAPASGYPYTYGNGSNITDSDGTVDGGTCVIIPIGVGAVVEVDFIADSNDEEQAVGTFFAANSAEEP